MRSSTCDERLATVTPSAAWQRCGLSRACLTKTGHGNDRVWKAWKAKKPAFHPSHTLWKSLRDSHIPTASAAGCMSCCSPFNSNHRHRKGLVTDVSGPQRNACPGTLTPERGLVSLFACAARKPMRVAVAGGNGPLKWVTEDAQRLETGRRACRYRGIWN
jgi:hypothetical protein